MLIPTKYQIKDESSIEPGSVEVVCKYCGAKFAVPPSEITEDLMAATCCEDPGCIEKMNAEAAAGAAASLKQSASDTAAATVATALGK